MQDRANSRHQVLHGEELGAQGGNIQYLSWIFMLGSTESWGVGQVYSRGLSTRCCVSSFGMQSADPGCSSQDDSVVKPRLLLLGKS